MEYKEILNREKTCLYITWIKQGGDEDDRTLSEQMDIIEKKSKNINDAVAESKKVMANIE